MPFACRSTSVPGQTTPSKIVQGCFFHFLCGITFLNINESLSCDVNTFRNCNKNFSILIKCLFWVVFQEFGDNTERDDLCNLIKNITNDFTAFCSEVLRDFRSHFYASGKRLTSTEEALGSHRKLRHSAVGLLWQRASRLTLGFWSACFPNFPELENWMSLCTLTFVFLLLEFSVWAAWLFLVPFKEKKYMNVHTQNSKVWRREG